MAKFNAKNDIYSTRDLIIERVRYSLEAHNNLLTRTGPKNIVDYNFADRGKYGKIDYNGNPIIPLATSLKTVTGYGGTASAILLINFVADAFSDLKDRMQGACRTGIIPNDHPFLSGLEAVRGYLPPIKDYDEYMTTILATYNQVFIQTSPNRGKIINFQDYLSYFERFVETMGPQFPVTFTGWYRSKYSSIFSSGLAIDVAGLPIDDDAPKADIFIDSTVWPYYIKAAKYHGFSVSKNAPWLLVADLSSPAMQAYMERYNLLRISAVFDKQYYATLGFETTRLRDLLIQSYNNFVRTRPYYKEVQVCKDFTTKQIIHNRNVTNVNVINKQLSNLTLYKVYTRIRNLEEGTPFKKADMARIIKKLNIFYIKLGPTNGLEYVNEQFRSLYKFKTGSAIDQRRRKAIREQMIEEEQYKSETSSATSPAPPTNTPMGGSSSGGSGY
tara:strand:+ start:2572 stop:3900 length:1329 start_codon:yes stop_codon:yes gene_type:complete